MRPSIKMICENLNEAMVTAGVDLVAHGRLSLSEIENVPEMVYLKVFLYKWSIKNYITRYIKLF